MKKWLLVVGAVSALMLTSCASTFSLSWTMPSTDNEGTCANRVLVPSAPGTGVRVIFAFTQGTTFAPNDTVTGTVGQVFTNRLFTVPKPGVWVCTARMIDLVGNLAVCDTTIQVIARGKPGTISDLRQP